MTAALSNSELLTLTAKIVSAHVSHNAVSPHAPPAVIRSVYDILNGLGIPLPEARSPTPAVPVKKSVFPDYIVCLEDGKKLKMMKRHIKTAYGMTPTSIASAGGCRRHIQ